MQVWNLCGYARKEVMVKMLNKETSKIAFRTQDVRNSHGISVTQYWIPRVEFIKLFFKSGCKESLAFIDFVCNLLREHRAQQERMETTQALSSPELQQKTQELEQLRSWTSSVNELFAAAQRSWNEMAVELAHAKAEAAAKNAIVEHKDIFLTKAVEELDFLKKIIGQKDAEIATKDAQLAAKDVSLAEKSTLVEAKDRVIIEKNAEIASIRTQKLIAAKTIVTRILGNMSVTRRNNIGKELGNIYRTRFGFGPMVVEYDFQGTVCSEEQFPIKDLVWMADVVRQLGASIQE